MFDLRSPIWGFGESCTGCSRHKFRARKCFIKHALFAFYVDPTVWLRFQRGTFRVPGFGRGRGVGICPFDSPHISSCLLPSTHMVYLLPFSSYLPGYKSVSVGPSVPDTMTDTALEAIVSSSSNQVIVQCARNFNWASPIGGLLLM